MMDEQKRGREKRGDDVSAIIACNTTTGGLFSHGVPNVCGWRGTCLFLRLWSPIPTTGWCEGHTRERRTKEPSKEGGDAGVEEMTMMRRPTKKEGKRNLFGNTDVLKKRMP